MCLANSRSSDHLRASQRVYLASAGAVGTIAAGTSHSEGQSTSTDLVPDAPAESTNSETNHVLIEVKPEPRKTVFADLP